MKKDYKTYRIPLSEQTFALLVSQKGKKMIKLPVSWGVADIQIQETQEFK
jgi:hypothetical protein